MNKAATDYMNRKYEERALKALHSPTPMPGPSYHDGFADATEFSMREAEAPTGVAETNATSEAANKQLIEDAVALGAFWLRDDNLDLLIESLDAHRTGAPHNPIHLHGTSAMFQASNLLRQLREAMKEGVLLSRHEQEYVLSNPTTIRELMHYHDSQQMQSDSMGAETTGNALRYEELRQLGEELTNKDIEQYDEPLRSAFKKWG